MGSRARLKTSLLTQHKSPTDFSSPHHTCIEVENWKVEMEGSRTVKTQLTRTKGLLGLLWFGLHGTDTEDFQL